MRKHITPVNRHLLSMMATATLLANSSVAMAQVSEAQLSSPQASGISQSAAQVVSTAKKPVTNMEVVVGTGAEMVGFVLPANGQLGGAAPAVIVSPAPAPATVAPGGVVVPVVPGSVDVAPASESGVPLEGTIVVIDNDTLAETETTQEWKWEEIPDEPGKTQITAGAQFPVVVLSEHNSKTSKVGTPVEGRLNVDVKIGGKLVASKGCRVVGHVFSVRQARRLLHAELSTKSWMRANGAIGIQFDEIISHNGEHLPLIAKPAKQPRIVVNKNEGRVMGVNHNGEVASPLSTQLKGQAAHLAIRAGCSAAGVFSMGAVPLAYGVVGALNPSFAFLKPVGLNVRHRRLKGFAMGVCQGLPGGFLISDMVIKGPEAVVKPGDVFLCEFKQAFTGEPATAAELMPGASTKVEGEVLSGVREKKTGTERKSRKKNNR